MGFFLVKSPLSIAIGAALVQPGQVVELEDEEGARLIANGTVEEAHMAPEDQAVYEAAKAAAGIAPNEPMVSSPAEADSAAEAAAADDVQAPEATTSRKAKAKA